MSLRSQIRRDLHNHSDDKLYKWVCDTVELYRIADLSSRLAVADMIFSMVTAIGALSAAYDVNREALFEMLKKALDITHQKYQ
jgi:hypothetical protein